MINLSQLELLEAKIESAVEKISQLQVENDALRNRVQELSNALSAKSEQLSLAEKDQEKIENGILKALNRLNSIENSVLKSAGTTSAAVKSVEGNVSPVSIPHSETESVSDNKTDDENIDSVITESYENEQEIENEIDIPVNQTEIPVSQDSVSNPFDMNKSDIPGFDIF